MCGGGGGEGVGRARGCVGRARGGVGRGVGAISFICDTHRLKFL